MTTLILPGWLNSGPAHWQSLWEQKYGYVRVQQHDWSAPLRGDWITRLEDVVRELPTAQPVLLVAHSLGCHLVAAWAAISTSTARVKGALLVAPPDVARDDFPPALHSWRRPVLTTLPFAATCVVACDDRFASAAAGRAYAAAWSAACVDIGAHGHINGDSGLGDWPEGHGLLQDLQQQPSQSDSR